MKTRPATRLEFHFLATIDHDLSACCPCCQGSAQMYLGEEANVARNWRKVSCERCGMELSYFGTQLQIAFVPVEEGDPISTQNNQNDSVWCPDCNERHSSERFEMVCKNRF